MACLSVLVFSFVFYLYSVSGSVFLAKAASGITYGSESNQTILNWDDTSRMNFSYKEIIVSDGSNTFILMDRNLGAKDAWDWTTWEDESANYDSASDYYGYYYQWWNNYWFSAKTKNAGAWKVFTNSVPSNYLSSRWIANSQAWNTNNDLWWDVTNSDPARHWPCPVWWHVPTQNEWNMVYNTWKNADGKSTDESSEVKNFAKDLKLPPAGSRFYGSLLFNNRGSNGYYWSSSHGISNQSAANLFFYDSPSSSYFNFYQTSERSNWLPVRCFKNSSETKTYTVTFDTRWWMPEIESQKVKELDTATKPSEIPIKFWTQFIAWTTADKKEFDFSFPIIQDITLYAKWEWESDSPYYDEDNYLLTADWIVVTWVANTIEYLTSLYLYVTDPYASTSVELKYNSELNALLINSPINANGMGIWFNKFWEWVVGSVSIWWSWNVFNLRGQEVFDDYGDYTWRKNGRNDSAVAIWWESNRPGPMWGVVVWWKNSEAHFSNSAVIWWVDSNVWGHHSVFLWSNKSSLNVQDWSSIDMWYNNHWDKHTYLIWSWIDLHPRWYSWASAVGNVFAWSPGVEWFPLLWWGLWWQQWFYINAKNGFWLNTSTPRLTFDFRSWWPLKVIAAKWIKNTTLNFGDWRSDGIRCWDQGNTKFFRWTLAYVQRNGIGAFCWCNGSYWMPLSSDAVEQSLCAESKVDARDCDWAEILHNVIFHTWTKWAARWDENANDWKWAWINLNWTFMWVPSLLSGDIRECSYTCAVWYHPNNKSAKWWFTWDCVPCDPLTGWQYVTPWTWVKDCEFRCNGWYKYDKWAEKNSDRCTPCKAWEWTPNLNQFSKCNICKLPRWIPAVSGNWNAGIVFTWWILWNWTTWSGEPYFRKFISFASTENGCKFECASWFYLWSDWFSCVECWIWTYSRWKINWWCAPCENMEAKDISFSYTDIYWVSHSDRIDSKIVSKYLTKWVNWPESCEWECNSEIWLVKDWKTCKCPDGSHLELVDWKPKCVSNIMNMVCQWELWVNAIRGKTIFTGASWNWTWNNWVRSQKKWTYSSKSSDMLWICEWTCPYGYKQNGNDCTPILIWECSSAVNWKVVGSSFSSWNSESSLCSKGTLKSAAVRVQVDYHDSTKDPEFQFYPQPYLWSGDWKPSSPNTNRIKYAVSWVCEWYGKNPQFSALCYAYQAWIPADGKCDNDQRSGVTAIAKCATDFTNCNTVKSCPPIWDEKKTSDWHWKTWICPWVFGWNPSSSCHSCDETYDWDFSEKKCVKDKDIWTCEWTKPGNTSNMKMWDESYVIPFDIELDDYAPKTMPYTLVIWNFDDELLPCQYRCLKWYVWQRNGQHCVPEFDEKDCVWNGNIENAIYGKKTYSKVFSVFTDDYILDPASFDIMFHFVNKADQLWECEFTCKGWYFWNGTTCEEYTPEPEYPQCWTVQDDCKEHDKCEAEKQCKKDKSDCLSDEWRCETGKERCENTCETCNCSSDDEECKTECTNNKTSCLSDCDKDWGDCDYDCDRRYRCSNNYGTSNCPECVADLSIGPWPCNPWEYTEPVRISPNVYSWKCSTADWSLDCGVSQEYNCDNAEFTNAHSVWKREKLTYEEYQTYPNKLYVASEAPWKPCSFACNEWYSFIVNGDYPNWACVICKQWEMSEQIEYCTIEMESKCGDDKYYDKDEKKCFPFGNCYYDYDDIDNSLPAHSYIPWHWTDTSYYRPIGDQGKVTRKCHEGWTVSENSCEYVCEDWYYCSSSDWICTKWPFKCFNWHINRDSAYIYQNPTATSDRRSTNSLYVYETHVEWDFESDEDLKNYAISKYG